MADVGGAHQHGPMDDSTQPTGTIQLPAPTAWPMVFALGISLVLAGMVTHWVISLLGLVMAVPAIVGWFFQVLPHEHHINVDVHADVVEIRSSRESLAYLPVGDRHRKLIPIETFSVMAGLKGGIAGGIAMIVPATLFSLIKYHSVWYAANLLAAGGFVSWANESDAFLAQFHLQGLLAAAVDSWTHFCADWIVVWSDATDVSPEADPHGRLYCAIFVDGSTLLRDWRDQPDSESTNRLAMVCDLADNLRPGGGICRQSFGEGADAAVSGIAFCRSSRSACAGRA